MYARVGNRDLVPVSCSLRVWRFYALIILEYVYKHFLLVRMLSSSTWVYTKHQRWSPSSVTITNNSLESAAEQFKLYEGSHCLSKKPVKYISWDSNPVHSCLLRTDLLISIFKGQHAQYFTLTADESADLSDKEQFLSSNVLYRRPTLMNT